MKGLAELGEFGLIDHIRARFPQPTAPELGIGDDAALLSPSAGRQVVVSTDLLAEGVHFDLGFGPARLLGRKSLAVNLSDLASMGAIPRWFFLSLAIPSGFSSEIIEGFLDGLAELACEHNCILAGGDTCGSKGGLTVSVTIMGEQRPELILKRSGAQPGDDIWVSGSLGDAALGLQLLMEGTRLGGVHDPLLLRQLNPTPRCELGLKLAEAGLVNAMIDISDGLLADLGHICEQSVCGAEVLLGQLPLSPTLHSCSSTQSVFPWPLVISGGEDYELCFTAPADNRAAIRQLAKTAGIQVTVIGKVTNSRQVHAILSDGTHFQPSASGYTHF
ncbi:thiamine-phosphate kinase [Trichlorobacter lovleyi]|uniref:thiamine-phosphate kinase n=1 Tax=Trichlorobacter lovleyi TaxID=313985 RepID=UPI00224039F8|nr:thiamine-phosphate kinase [Trichlorobacter lovleyi]QOX79756.1 thiamine-phosphate kinase [Trichlorobacter lovleyi]